MIMTRTPFRVSFCGGGSDIPSFYEKHGGCVLSTTINQYMYISIHPSFYKNTTVLKYSQTEIVENISNIQHQYFREGLYATGVQGVEITSTADVPAGTGLGSSSAFMVGLLHALYAYIGKHITKEQLAQKACEIEINQLGQPIGKQDQYATAYGGLNFYEFTKNGHVTCEPVLIQAKAYKALEKNLLLFYTGEVHSASRILKEQKKNVANGKREQTQIRLCEMARTLKQNLESGDIEMVGDILRESWELKKTLASGITNSVVDDAYETAIANGARGGKLLGAGGGGFLLFYVPENAQTRLRNALRLMELPFSFEEQGSALIYSDTHRII